MADVAGAEEDGGGKHTGGEEVQKQDALQAEQQTTVLPKKNSFEDDPVAAELSFPFHVSTDNEVPKWDPCYKKQRMVTSWETQTRGRRWRR